MKTAGLPGWTRRRWLQALPGAAASAWAGAAGAAPAPGDAIAWPSLVTVDGHPLDAAAWQGVPVVVVFWATWCAYCQRHNARIDALHRALDPQRLRILGVAQDGDASAVQAYLRRHGYQFPTVLDRGPLRGRFTARRVIPMTCTVGADGRLLQCIPGEMAEDDVVGLARLALPARR